MMWAITVPFLAPRTETTRAGCNRAVEGGRTTLYEAICGQGRYKLRQRIYA